MRAFASTRQSVISEEQNTVQVHQTGNRASGCKGSTMPSASRIARVYSRSAWCHVGARVCV